MARSKYIGDFAYHNFTIGDDYIELRYDKTKADQVGEKRNDRHICAYPFNPLVCYFLTLGIWFTLDAKGLSNTTSLFSNPNLKEEAPINEYMSRLAQLLKYNIGTVDKFVRRDHINTHGL